ncbi:unnamed protein product [Acanthoscelides obtectus]|uniref:Ankyrin repeat, SAM and basic leucine zipper domain-containing protein 1 n=1 Tax=Acanthoscelides obtectus TaxID=200917 RepID=A0A9P0LS39_ACAOB|nr:unnamed protein product [Acanthoscelides obtectus]CAK1668615.1 Ankyrin repeat, SAM and basic leucine zipper domain-containing protein 1 [Acanthoscelides obtectus]
MAYRPDSDSDSDCFSDDPDYEYFKTRTRQIANQNKSTQVLSEADRKEQECQQLYKSICNGDIAAVQQVLHSGYDINSPVYDNWTSIQLAVSFGKYEITELLVASGANVNSDRDGYTALMMACNCPSQTSPYSDTMKIIKLLVEKGANVKSINHKRMTALMLAASNGHLVAVKYLLPLSNKDAVDNQGWNALYWAVSTNQIETVSYLLEQNLDYSKPDVRNNTAIDIAKNSNLIQILELFPKEKEDVIFSTIQDRALAFEESFSLWKTGKRPQFFVDICNMLYGIMSEPLIELLAKKNITLSEFLSITDADLQNLGVKLPYQRAKILGVIYKFHKYPYHPKSLYVMPLTEKYSNHDVAIQVLSTVKQVIAMEGSIEFILKNFDESQRFQNDKDLARTLKSVKHNIALCEKSTKNLMQRAEQVRD